MLSRSNFSQWTEMHYAALEERIGTVEPLFVISDMQDRGLGGFRECGVRSLTVRATLVRWSTAEYHFIRSLLQAVTDIFKQ